MLRDEAVPNSSISSIYSRPEESKLLGYSILSTENNLQTFELN